MEVLIEIEEGIVNDITFWPNNDPDPVIRAHVNSSPKFYVFDHTDAETRINTEMESARRPVESTELDIKGGPPSSVAERLAELEQYYKSKGKKHAR